MPGSATPAPPAPPAGPPTQKVSDVIATYRQSRVSSCPCASTPHGSNIAQRFKAPDAKTTVTSLDFDDTGELAVIARDDDTLQIYNCREGKHAKELKSQKYGVHLARFSHHAQSIIYASTKVDGSLHPVYSSQTLHTDRQQTPYASSLYMTIPSSATLRAIQIP
jgi:COMPASS component SWD2